MQKNLVILGIGQSQSVGPLQEIYAFGMASRPSDVGYYLAYQLANFFGLPTNWQKLNYNGVEFSQAIHGGWRHKGVIIILGEWQKFCEPCEEMITPVILQPEYIDLFSQDDLVTISFDNSQPFLDVGEYIYKKGNKVSKISVGVGLKELVHESQNGHYDFDQKDKLQEILPQACWEIWNKLTNDFFYDPNANRFQVL